MVTFEDRGMQLQENQVQISKAPEYLKVIATLKEFMPIWLELVLLGSA